MDLYKKKFIHIPLSVEALEPKEIGVEWLSRGIKDISLGYLTNHVKFNLKYSFIKNLINRRVSVKDNWY